MARVAAWHRECDWEIDHAYWSGVYDGWRAARLDEREVIREALDPTAADLEAAIRSHDRMLSTRRARILWDRNAGGIQ